MINLSIAAAADALTAILNLSCSKRECSKFRSLERREWVWRGGRERGDGWLRGPIEGCEGGFESVCLCRELRRLGKMRMGKSGGGTGHLGGELQWRLFDGSVCWRQGTSYFRGIALAVLFLCQAFHAFASDAGMLRPF